MRKTFGVLCILLSVALLPIIGVYTVGWYELSLHPTAFVGLAIVGIRLLED